MKILIVSDIPTKPITTGARKIINSYIELFKSWGHEVHFLMINKYNMRRNYRINIKKAIAETRKEWGDFYHQYDYSLCENVYTNLNIISDKLFHNGYRKCDDIYPMGLNKEISRLDKIYHFDALLVNYFYLSKALDALPIKRKALFTHDSFSMHEKSQNHQAVYYLAKQEEQKALSRANYIFAMQNVEAGYFKSLSPHSIVLINYSNYKYHIQSITGNNNILYLASGTKINLQGIQWFIKEILPLIKQYYPKVRLLIGGEICNLLQEYKTCETIKLMGRVNSLDLFYSLGDIAINPCQLGTGLKIKTFEAISYDKVTLSHPNGLIGIFDKNNSPVFSSEKSSEWVEYLKKAWNSPAFIRDVKNRNRLYIKRMNNFIYEQYKIWLDGKTPI